jgi:hypothetical protein
MPMGAAEFERKGTKATETERVAIERLKEA